MKIVYLDADFMWPVKYRISHMIKSAVTVFMIQLSIKIILL
jgi:hypothetical protein